MITRNDLRKHHNVVSFSLQRRDLLYKPTRM